MRPAVPGTNLPPDPNGRLFSISADKFKGVSTRFLGDLYTIAYTVVHMTTSFIYKV